MNLVFVITDSVTNSVFESQVVVPLLQQKKQNPTLSIYIISFERNLGNKKNLPPEITIIYFKSYPFCGRFSLLSYAYHLRRFLKQFLHYQIIARGPLAGYIAYKATTHNCQTLTIQARGLLAAEYAYIKKDAQGIFRILHIIRGQLYASLEQFVFNLPAKKKNVQIEAVSAALKQYLQNEFQTPENRITIADVDIPAKISSDLLARWRIEKRAEMEIPTDAYVYVYCGSAKPWQMPEQMMSFFAHKMKQNSNALFLILTQDLSLFNELAKKYNISNKQIRIKTIDHASVYHYLAAADAGLLLREKHILNWISRPTKALEYLATGLAIMHNDTVAYLTAVQNPCIRIDI